MSRVCQHMYYYERLPAIMIFRYLNNKQQPVARRDIAGALTPLPALEWANNGLHGLNYVSTCFRFTRMPSMASASRTTGTSFFEPPWQYGDMDSNWRTRFASCRKKKTTLSVNAIQRIGRHNLNLGQPLFN